MTWRSRSSDWMIPDEEDEMLRDYMESRSRLSCSLEDQMFQQKEKEENGGDQCYEDVI